MNQHSNAFTQTATHGSAYTIIRKPIRNSYKSNKHHKNIYYLFYARHNIKHCISSDIIIPVFLSDHLSNSIEMNTMLWGKYIVCKYKQRIHNLDALFISFGILYWKSYHFDNAFAALTTIKYVYLPFQRFSMVAAVAAAADDVTLCR